MQKYYKLQKIFIDKYTNKKKGLYFYKILKKIYKMSNRRANFVLVDIYMYNFLRK